MISFSYGPNHTFENTIVNGSLGPLNKKKLSIGVPANLLYDLSNRANTSLSQRLLTVSSLPTTPYRGMIREYQITVPPVMRSKTTFIHFGADLQPNGNMPLSPHWTNGSEKRILLLFYVP